MEALLASITLVALAETGDKTQLLSFVIAAKLRQPYAIIAADPRISIRERLEVSG